jgi:hypothetical protein
VGDREHKKILVGCELGSSIRTLKMLEPKYTTEVVMAAILALLKRL